MREKEQRDNKNNNHNKQIPKLV